MLHDRKVLSGGGNTGIKHQTNNAISISKKMFMLPVKIARSLFAVFLTCVIALNCFISPAFAATSSSDFAGTDSATDSFVRNFWGVIGTAAGSIVVCYVFPLVIAPIAPPLAASVTGMCPAIGAMLGEATDAAGANAIIAMYVPLDNI